MREILKDEFTGVTVAVYGDVMLDRYLLGDVARISPEAPIPVVDLKEERLVAGGAANVAANIRGLGADVRLIGVVGDDKEAASLKEVLDLRDIDCGNLYLSNNRPTTVKSRVLSGSHQIARVDRERAMPLDKKESEAVLSYFKECSDDCDVLVVSDYGKGMCDRGTVRQLISLAKNVGIPVLVDPKGIDYLKYEGAFLLTPNRKEALELLLAKTHEEGNAKDAGAYILESFDIENLVVTLGAEGMGLFRRNQDDMTIKASARNVYDVTGAGDTVIAVISVALGAGMPIEDAVKLANVAAGCVIESVGTTAISLDSLKRALETADIKGSGTA